MALETAKGDKVVLVAKGPDAREAVNKLRLLIAEGLGDEGCVPAPALATTTLSPISAAAPRPKDENPNLIVGICGFLRTGDRRGLPGAPRGHRSEGTRSFTGP